MPSDSFKTEAYGAGPLNTLAAKAAKVSDLQCSLCPRTMGKAKKIHLGKPICEACYARLYFKKPCCRCENGFARVLREEQKPVCRACLNKNRVCLRCERPINKAALIVANKPVCPRCAPHYRVPEPCEDCGRPSKRLSRIVGVTTKRICEICRGKLICATCSVCGKFRERHAISADGEPLCKKCAANPGATHPCPDCNETVGGEGVAPCLTCSLKRSLNKKTEGTLRLLKSPVVRQLFRNFIDWSISTGRQARVSSKYDSYASSAVKLDQAVGDSAAVSAELVLKTFRPEELRLSGLLSQYLAEQGLFPASQALADAAETRRIEAILQESRPLAWNAAVIQFASELETKRLSLRSKRAYLRAAVEFLKAAKVDKVMHLSQDSLLAFIRAQPGYRASLTPFVRHLKESGHPGPLSVQMKSTEGRTVEGVRAELNKLLRAISLSTDERQSRALLARAMSLAYGVPLETILRLSQGELEDAPSELRLKLEDWIVVEMTLAKWIRKLLLVDNGRLQNSDLLFPGRTLGMPISVTAVGHHVRKVLAVSGPSSGY